METLLPFWEKLTKEQQNKLFASAKEVSYKKGDILHAGSNDCSGVFLIKQGQLRSYIVK